MVSRRKKERKFQKLLNEFSAYIRSLVYKYQLERLGLDPEDLLQEIRLKLWKIIDDEKNIHNPASYIKKVVESAVIDQIRKIRREEEVYLSEQQKLISELDPRPVNTPAFSGSLKQSVLKAADRLMDSRRTVVKLYLLNMSLPEIAAYLHYTEAKTRNLLYRGLADLKDIIKKMGLEDEII
ncbi:MAG: sigma-70 family RNA polymerase sigma factor [Candidatus Saccharicenans sp.]